MTMLPITHLTIHCAATPEGRDVKAAEVEKWDIARFGQKSYHWIIELDGNIHRSLDDTVRGAHTGGHNTGNIGICYVGGCDVHMKGKDTRTPAQCAALESLVRDYQRKYPGITVQGHRDWPNVHKDCPSFDVRAWMKSVGL
jgi:N-acetyl-anhydromuramyl-L-alanine amidase AmpD